MVTKSANNKRSKAYLSFFHHPWWYFLPEKDELYKAMVNLGMYDDEKRELTSILLGCHMLMVDRFFVVSMKPIEPGRPLPTGADSRILNVINQMYHTKTKKRQKNALDFQLRTKQFCRCMLLRKRDDSSPCPTCRWLFFGDNIRTRRVRYTNLKGMEKEPLPEQSSKSKTNTFEEDRDWLPSIPSQSKIPKTPKFVPKNLEMVKKVYEECKVKEPVGTIRSFTEIEMMFWTLQSKTYRHFPTLKDRPNNWMVNPPLKWDERLLHLKKTKRQIVRKVCDAAIVLSKSIALSMERSNWIAALNELPGTQANGSINMNQLEPEWAEHVYIVVVMFCKSTNGTSDKIILNHWQRAIPKLPKLSLKLVTEQPEIMAQILRQTSCWVKNSVCLRKVFSHIRTDESVGLPTGFDYWIRFREFQSKTISLIQYCLGVRPISVPVDRHVMDFFSVLGCVPPGKEEELAFQLHYILDEHKHRPVNDAIGSRGQLKSDKKMRPYMEDTINSMEDFYVRRFFVNWLCQGG